MSLLHQVLVQQGLRMLDYPRSLVAQLAGPHFLGAHAKSVPKHHEHGLVILRDVVVVSGRVTNPLQVSRRRPFLSHDALN